MDKRKTRPADNITLKRMVSVARTKGETGDSEAARALHRRSASRAEGMRAKRFLDIDRGTQA